MSDTVHKFKPGDRFIWPSFSGPRAGAIVKASKVTALVRYDDADQDERIYLDGLRPETPDDIAKRDHKAAMKAWRERRPATTLVRVVFSRYGSNQDESGADVGLTGTPERMRTAAAELLKIADWFEERPKSNV